MLEPRNDGDFEDWDGLAPTLAPLLSYIGGYFLPWTTANARALEAGAAEFADGVVGAFHHGGVSGIDVGFGLILLD